MGTSFDSTRLVSFSRRYVVGIFKILALLTIFALVGWIMKILTNPMGLHDSYAYLLVAQSPFELTAPPFGYRIAIPYLAAFLSASLHMNLERTFEVLQIGLYSLVLTSWYLWATLGLKLTKPTSVMTCILFIFSYPGVYNLHNAVHVGFGEHLFLLLGFMAIFHNSYWLLYIIIIISCFVKENVGVLLIPTFAVNNLYYEKLRLTFVRTVALSATFLVISVLLRTGVFFKSGLLVQYTSMYTNWAFIKYCYNYNGEYDMILLSIGATFGVTWLLALVGFIVAPNRMRVLLILPVLATIMTVWAAGGTARMVGLGFPVILAFSGLALDRMHKTLAGMIVITNAAFFLCVNHQTHNPIEIGLLGIAVLILYVARFSWGMVSSEHC